MRIKRVNCYSKKKTMTLEISYIGAHPTKGHDSRSFCIELAIKS